MSPLPRSWRRHPATRTVAAIVGGLLVVVGVALLVLPVPGLLLVLAGVLVLAQGFSTPARYVEPIRRQAMEAARRSVATRARIVMSVLTGVGLMILGVIWGVVPTLPFGGWVTGVSLILSGTLLLVLLAFSYRRRGRPRPSRVR